MSKNEVFIKTTAMLEIEGEEVEVEAEGFVRYYYDRSYGEDADGNRGKEKYDIDAVEYAKAYLDGERVHLSKDQDEAIRDALAQRFLEGGYM